MLASGFLPPSHLCLLLQLDSCSLHRVCSGQRRSESQVVPYTAARGRTLARWRRAKTPAAPRTACVLRPGHSASTPPRRSLRSGARPAGRVRVGSPVRSLLEVAAAAALAARTPLGIRTKRLLPAPRGWSSHPNPGLAQGQRVQQYALEDESPQFTARTHWLVMDCRSGRI
ncbi:leucine-rich repeat-containing protein 3B isoform X2 [Peromyscus maniculatus bairdii]|uniref:leucine-rich repeat-containing protein 3B isoform X2 n=1 Tax=Peromyscus maniculatus bairdii TaxID=230844 RepID=UPI003FD4EC4D